MLSASREFWAAVGKHSTASRVSATLNGRNKELTAVQALPGQVGLRDLAAKQQIGNMADAGPTPPVPRQLGLAWLTALRNLLHLQASEDLGVLWKCYELRLPFESRLQSRSLESSSL